MRNPIPYVVTATGHCMPLRSLFLNGDFVCLPGSTSAVRVSQIMDQIVLMDEAIAQPEEELVTLTNAD